MRIFEASDELYVSGGWYRYLVFLHKQHLPSFRRRPESSKPLNFLDPGLRRDDVVSGKHAFLDGYYLVYFLA